MQRLPAAVARRFWRKCRRAQRKPENARENLERPCLIWLGATDQKGYGVFRAFPGCMGLRSGIVRVHRLAYWLHYGPFPQEAEIDHKCRVTRCLEPTHLQLLGPVEHAKTSNTDRELDKETEERILKELKSI